MLPQGKIFPQIPRIDKSNNIPDIPPPPITSNYLTTCFVSDLVTSTLLSLSLVGTEPVRPWRTNCLSLPITLWPPVGWGWSRPRPGSVWSRGCRGPATNTSAARAIISVINLTRSRHSAVREHGLWTLQLYRNALVSTILQYLRPLPAFVFYYFILLKNFQYYLQGDRRRIKQPLDII